MPAERVILAPVSDNEVRIVRSHLKFLSGYVGIAMHLCGESSHLRVCKPSFHALLKSSFALNGMMRCPDLS